MDRSLLYATGGVAFARSNAGGGQTINHNARNQIVAGPVAGAGIEWLVSPNVALRAEGLYYWFNQNDTPEGQSGVGGIKSAWAVRAGASVFRVAEMENALRESFTPSAVAGILVPADELNSDIHASAEYRAHMVTVMARRAVAAAG